MERSGHLRMLSEIGKIVSLKCASVLGNELFCCLHFFFNIAEKQEKADRSTIGHNFKYQVSTASVMPCAFRVGWAVFSTGDLCWGLGEDCEGSRGKLDGWTHYQINATWVNRLLRILLWGAWSRLHPCWEWREGFSNRHFVAPIHHLFLMPFSPWYYNSCWFYCRFNDA